MRNFERIILALGIVFFLWPSAQAADRLTGLRLQSCGPAFCQVILSDEAWQSEVDGTLSFLQARVQIVSKKTSVIETEFSTADGLFDQDAGLIVLRNAYDKSHHGDAIIDVNKNKVLWL